MKTTMRSLFALGCLLCSTVVFGQAHVLTYVKVTRPVDALVSIAGESHTMVRMPVRDMVSGQRFAVLYPVSNGDGFFFGDTIATSHKPADFVSNIEIDGYPAQVSVFDGFTYNIGTPFGGSGYDLTVTGFVTVNVTIDLGDALMTLTNSLNAKNALGEPFLTDVHVGDSANAVGYAEWWKYDDEELTPLVNGLDKWIDHIRIVPQ